MATIFGHLNLSDVDRPLTTAEGQRVVYNFLRQWLDEQNTELEKQLTTFVSEITPDYTRLYRLPGGGYLQPRGEDGRFSAVKAVGGWNVAFPLEDLGAAIVSNDVARAYMTTQELEMHVRTVWDQNVRSVRDRILRALFNSSPRNFIDPMYGALTVRPLANGDGTLYPPPIGEAEDSEENHYLTSGAARITDDNNPFALIRAELEEHFGQGNIIAFINPDERADAMALRGFVNTVDQYIIPGDDTAKPTNIPAAPGIVIGRQSGIWISEWPYVPSGYVLGVDLNAIKPLIKRVDPADTGLGQGLQLVAREEQFPFEGAYWRHRFGFGCGNRLNGVVVQLTTFPSYTTPAGLSW